MTRRVRSILPLVFAAVLTVSTVSACTGAGTGGGGGTTGGGASTENTAAALEGVSAIASDWAGSAHAVPVSFAAMEEDCVRCHDGRAFAEGTVTTPAQLDKPFGPYVVATDCRACHTGQGNTVLMSGQVKLQTTPTTITAGLGALCMTCHQERSAPDAKNADRRAPHPSSQAGVFTATGGFRESGLQYGSTTKHSSVTNACVGCHMLDVNGTPSHTFKVTDAKAACGKCHEGITELDRKVGADYDGNGQLTGMQEEVKGLLSILADAAVKRSNATTLTESNGLIVFKRGETTVTPITDDVYQAAYNWALVTNDSSFGLHNPRFTIDLLQNSYMALTGNPVPNAKAYPRPKSGGSGGSEATGGAGGETSGTTTSP